LKGGDTFSGSITSTSATAINKPITLSSYGTGNATVSAGSNAGLYVQNQGGWTVSNLNFVGNGSGDSGGVFFYNESASSRLTNLTFTNLDISGFGDSGLSVGTWNKALPYYSPQATQGWDTVTIDGVNSHNNLGEGVFVWGQTT